MFHELSLLGFEPWDDYDRLLYEGRGRRISRPAPESSLLIAKATGEIPHGGGARIEVGSPDYQRLVRWIEMGTPYGSDDDPTLPPGHSDSPSDLPSEAPSVPPNRNPSDPTELTVVGPTFLFDKNCNKYWIHVLSVGYIWRRR